METSSPFRATGILAVPNTYLRELFVSTVHLELLVI